MIAEHILTPCLNHLIAQSGGAAGRLRPHAGKRVSVRGGPFRLQLRINDDGLFEGDSGELLDVEIRLPADAAARWFLDHEGVLAAARIEGSADLAEVLGQVFRKLRWDVEADLAPIVGDIAAVRLAQFLGGLGATHRTAMERVGSNVSGYLIQEAQLLPLRDEVSRCAQIIEESEAAISHLTDQIARLENRKSGLTPAPRRAKIQ